MSDIVAAASPTGMRLEQVILAAIKDRIQLIAKDDLIELCDAAEEWYDGRNSKMKTFARCRGVLPKGADYEQLSCEASDAISEIEKTRKQSSWLSSLMKLRDLGESMFGIDQDLRVIAAKSVALSQHKVYDQHILGIAQYALQELRRREQSYVAHPFD